MMDYVLLWHSMHHLHSSWYMWVDGNIYHKVINISNISKPRGTWYSFHGAVDVMLCGSSTHTVSRMNNKSKQIKEYPFLYHSFCPNHCMFPSIFNSHYYSFICLNTVYFKAFIGLHLISLLFSLLLFHKSFLSVHLSILIIHNQ